MTNNSVLERVCAAWHRTERIGVMLLILLLPALTVVATATSTSAQAIMMNNIVVTQASAGSELTISWQTNVASTGVVVYGPTAAGLAPNAQQPLGYSMFQRRLLRVLDITSAKSAGTGTAHSITIPS